MEEIKKILELYILWYNLGVSYIELKRFNRAIDEFKRSLEIDKTFESAWELLGYSYGQIEEHEKEIEAYLKALDLDPELESTWYNLGLAYYGKGYYDKAKDAFSQVLHSMRFIMNYIDFIKLRSEIEVIFTKHNEPIKFQ